jgi:dCTP deaminase
MRCARGAGSAGPQVAFILADGQIIGRLVHEPLTQAPERVHGQGIGSNDQRQGLELSKRFKAFDPAQR